MHGREKYVFQTRAFEKSLQSPSFEWIYAWIPMRSAEIENKPKNCGEFQEWFFSPSSW
jgi:hypothetical protein